ncbi:MAG: tetratricopeptide repeat protein, partial [Planctomycetaceae bacterium]
SMHRLVQEIAQYQLLESDRRSRLKSTIRWLFPRRYNWLQPNHRKWLQRSLQMLNGFCTGDPSNVNTWAPIYSPARPHLARILPTADKAGIAQPTARLMNEFGLHLHARADFADAEPLYRRALSIDETSYGPNHPTVAIRLNNLAELLRVTNRRSEAEPLYRRALSISATSYGPNHPEVARGLNGLAGLLDATNRPVEAEPLSRRSVEILVQFRQQTGHKHPHFEAVLGWYRSILESLGLDAAATESRLRSLLQP